MFHIFPLPKDKLISNLREELQALITKHAHEKDRLLEDLNQSFKEKVITVITVIIIITVITVITRIELRTSLNF